MAYSGEVAIDGSSSRKYRAYVTASTSSSTDTSVTISYTYGVQMIYAYQYGVACNVYVNGEWQKSTSGYLSSNPGGSWVTVCSGSGTKTISKSTSSFSVSVQCNAWGETVDGYGSAGGSTNVSVSVSVPAKTSYTVSYNANGGSGAPSSQTKWHGDTLTLSSTKPTRIGYTFEGWGTSENDTTVDYSAGVSYTSNAAITLYAIWAEHYLTVNYYSNYATSAFDGALNTVGADKNVLVRTTEFYYDNEYSGGLHNYSSSSGTTYMTRIRYDATGYWCTTTAEDIELEGDKTDIITYDGGIAIGEDKSFSSGQAVAEALGLSLESGNESIDLYANWILLASRVTVYDENGNAHKGLFHFIDDNGVTHYGILTVYGQDGKARTVI